MVNREAIIVKKLVSAIKDRLQGKVPLLSRRSPKWDGVRDDFVKSHPECAACGSKQKLQVHHIKPFHMDRSLELDTNNLITLCEDEKHCHLKIGHLGNFKNENPQVREQAAQMRKSLGLPA